MKLRLLLILFLCAQAFAQAQDTAYAHNILYTLSSKKFHGRGFYKNGELKAAKFIAKKIKTINLKPLSKNYLQPLNTSANIIKKTKITINNNAITPGASFVPHSTNSSNTLTINKLEWGTNAVFISSTDQTNEALIIQKSKCQPQIVIIDTCTHPKKINAFTIILKLNPENTKNVVIMTTHDFNANISGFQAQYNIYEIAYNHLPPTLQKPQTWNSLELSTKSITRPFTINNVMGLIPGQNTDSTIIVCAHYDHLGQMGKSIIFYGANDNACGIAMLLDLAKHYSTNKPNYNMLFIAFGGEEAGLLGSEYYTKNPLIPLSKTKFVLNLDLVGTGQVGATVVNATIFPNYFKTLDSINNQFHFIPALHKRGKAKNSDHHYFTEANIPSFFIYFEGTRSAYHDVFDTPQSLPLTHFELGKNLFINFLNNLP